MFIVVFAVSQQQGRPASRERVYYGACCRFSIDKYDLDMFPGLPDAIAGLAGLTREQLKSLGDIQSVEIKREI